MKSILSFVIFLVTSILCIGFIIYSTFINTRAVETELLITESIQSFLDTVTDRGAMTRRDYETLMANLGGTGGTYQITITVNRLFAIPNTSPLNPNFTPGSTVVSDFIRDYRPVYGFSSADGSFARLEVLTDPAGNVVEGTGPIFFRRHDLITLNLSQTSLMTHQINMTRQQNLPTTLRTWTFARAVRNSGSAMVENERPPICFDGIPCN